MTYQLNAHAAIHVLPGAIGGDSNGLAQRRNRKTRAVTDRQALSAGCHPQRSSGTRRNIVERNHLDFERIERGFSVFRAHAAINQPRQHLGDVDRRHATVAAFNVRLHHCMPWLGLQQRQHG